MEAVDPDEVIGQAGEEQRQRSGWARDALRWFLENDRLGELYPRGEAVVGISTHLDVDEETANNVISALVGDIVDPVQQVMADGERYVGIIDYRVYEDEGAYGYVDYDDRLGKRARVVCARCVEEHTLDEHITHATQGEGSSSADASWEVLLNKVTSHYAKEHDHGPEEVEPGASLLSGTTISGSTAWHDGNVTNSNGLTIGSQSVGIASNGVGTGELSFDPATQTELDNHAGDSDIHHAPYTDTDAQEQAMAVTFVLN